MMKKAPRTKITTRRNGRRKQKVALERPENGGTDAPIIDRQLADRATRMNGTLWDAWDHLPPSVRQSLHPPDDERRMAVLATRDVLCRINLNSPDDIFFVDQFADITFDLMNALDDGGDTNRSAIHSLLLQYLEYGFLVPRYRVRHKFRGRQRKEILSLSTDRTFVYNRRGCLREIQFAPLKDALGHDIGWIDYYRDQGLLVEGPHAIPPHHKAAAELTPLFTFSQSAEFRKVH